MKPLNRKEMILEAIANGEVPEIDPKNREEVLLKKIAEKAAAGGGGGGGAEPIKFIGSELSCSMPFAELYELGKTEIENRAIYSYQESSIDTDPCRCIYAKIGFETSVGEYVDLFFITGRSGDPTSSMKLKYKGVRMTENAMTLFEVE